MNTSMKVIVVVIAVLAASVARGAFSAPARSEQGMVATAHPLATEAALAILRAGGNATDAAIAAAFAISVVEPFSAGIGGGGFAVLHFEPTPKDAGAIKALDFREVAPARATRDMYIGTDGKVAEGLSRDGYSSVAVPGTVAGLAEMHRAHGRLPWRKVVAPAIRLARDGFVVDDHFVGAFEWRKDVLARFASTRAVFMKTTATGDVPYAIGDRLRQPDLARSLEDIAADPRSFYVGRIARAIAADMHKNGGLVTLEDLKAYQARWRDPLCGGWRGHNVCTMPPPSSGGVHLLQILNLLGNTDFDKAGWHSEQSLHLMIESMRIAYADRAMHLGDPAFTKVPVVDLVSPAYATLRSREIDPKRAKKSADVKAGTQAQLDQARRARESRDTSHLTVVDRDRNAVSLTFTVNYGFGSGVVVPRTGVLLNDEMDDFAAAPGVPNAYGLLGGEANSVQPGKVPLSSMTPTIVTREGRFFLSAGAPGGSTIITTTLQTLLHVIAFQMDCQAAVAAPRIHHQWLPDVVSIERFGLDEGTQKALEARGHVLRVSNDGWGNAMCVARRTDNGRDLLEGGADPRGIGLARGL